MKTYKLSKIEINFFLDILNNNFCNYDFVKNDNNDLFENSYYLVNVYDLDFEIIKKECLENDVKFELI